MFWAKGELPATESTLGLGVPCGMLVMSRLSGDGSVALTVSDPWGAAPVVARAVSVRVSGKYSGHNCTVASDGTSTLFAFGALGADNEQGKSATLVCSRASGPSTLKSDDTSTDLGHTNPKADDSEAADYHDDQARTQPRQALPLTTIVANRVQPGGAPVHSVAQLQALLDTRAGVFRVRNSRWTITNATVWLRSDRSLIMDSATTFEGTAEVPWTQHGSALGC